MLLVGAIAVHDWLREHRRKSLPGLSIHLAIRVADQQTRRRRYFFDFGGSQQNGAAFYLSASDRFVFSIEDAQGEAYNLDLLAGSRGIPLSEIIYLSLEAGTDGVRTFVRASVNGCTIGERELPFAVRFPPFAVGNLGSNRHGDRNAGFRLYELIVRDRTLDHKESTQLFKYMRSKHALSDTG